MASLNKVILIGRVAREPELRSTPSGKQVTNFAIAVDRRFGSGQDVDFINIVAWQKLAEICAQYLTKGKLIAIVGRIQVRNYEAQDGTRRTAYEVVANEMQMLDRGPAGSFQVSPPESRDYPETSSPGEDMDSIVSDDLPF
ncbi:MAG: single-stranded DNA-binding protein [Candidatus Eremiobacteraeota bacterium]|nr:single-stranded DNA-binding protein [Candidatus Eremiobacteraeota bacterium]